MSVPLPVILSANVSVFGDGSSIFGGLGDVVEWKGELLFLFCLCLRSRTVCRLLVVGILSFEGIFAFVLDVFVG